VIIFNSLLKSKEMNSVYSFNDFRDLLQAYYAHQKATVPGFTYARFSQLAGLKSPNYLKLVMDGKRGLTVGNIHQFAKALRLEGEEVDYFEALVLHGQAEGAAERDYYRQRLQRLKKAKPKKGKYVGAGGFVSRWYHPALVVCLYGEQNSGQVKKIANTLGISEAEVRQGLEYMHSAGIAQKREDGVFEVGESYLKFKGAFANKQQQKEFLRQQLELSLKAFRQQYETGAKFLSHTFTLSEENYNVYVKEIFALVERLTTISEEDKMERVAQLNVQLFPLVPFHFPIAE
jgi:uncharacterized protein (TIGR02147 family)